MKSIETFIFILLMVLTTGCQLPRTEPTFPFEHYAKLVPHDLELCVKENRGNFNILTLSGGAGNGAWGAGMLSQWVEQDHDVIVGVSTGALMSSLVYVKDYTHLKTAFTTTNNTDIFDIPVRNPLTMTSISTDRAITKTVERYCSNETIDQIAQEYIKTRRLLLTVSTDLDTGRVMVWNMGKIACRKDYELYRKVVVSSASIPILFPPQEINGHFFVDGGARTNVWVSDELLKLCPKNTNVYIVLNLMPSKTGEGKTPNSLGGISTRSIHLLIDSVTIGNVEYIRKLGLKYGIPIHVGQPAEGTPLVDIEFIPEQMTKLWDCGETWGRKPNWSNDIDFPY